MVNVDTQRNLAKVRTKSGEIVEMSGSGAV